MDADSDTDGPPSTPHVNGGPMAQEFVLADFLKEHERLKRWDFSHIKFTAEDLRAVTTSLLSPVCSVSNLFLCNCGIDDEGAGVLSDLIRNDTNMRLIHLGRNKITDEGLVPLTNALQQNSTLQYLWLKTNAFTCKGVQTLVDGLLLSQTHSNLTAVDLFNNSLGEEGVRILANALMTNRTIHRLYMGANRAGPGGAREIARVLTGSDALNSLSFDINAIRDEGVGYLADALKVNTSLTRLCIKYNGFGEAGTAQLADALSINTALRSLVFGHAELSDVLSEVADVDIELVRGQENKIGAGGARALGKLFLQHPPLEHLNLYNTGLETVGTDALEELITGVAASPALTSLNLDPEIGTAAVARFNTILTKHRQAVGHQGKYSVIPPEANLRKERRNKEYERERVKVAMEDLQLKRTTALQRVSALKKQKKRLVSDLEDQRDPDLFEEDSASVIAGQLATVKEELRVQQALVKELKAEEDALRQSVTRRGAESPLLCAEDDEADAADTPGDTPSASCGSIPSASTATAFTPGRPPPRVDRNQRRQGPSRRANASDATPPASPSAAATPDSPGDSPVARDHVVVASQHVTAARGVGHVNGGASDSVPIAGGRAVDTRTS